MKICIAYILISFYTENESAEHLNLKAGLYGWGKQSQEVQVEAFLPEIRQIADLLVDGRIALEVQCSLLRQERLEERTLSYRQHDYQVLWLKKLFSKSINYLLTRNSCMI